MTIDNVIEGEVIDDVWGNSVADEINDHEGRISGLEAANAGARLTTAEGEIDTLQANAAVIGARNSHSYNPGQIILDGGSCQFDVEAFRSGITANGDYSGWTVLTAGVYSVSWTCEISGGGSTYLTIAGTAAYMRVAAFGDFTYGSWTGYIAAGAEIVIKYAGASTPYLGGFLHIFRVAQGG